MKFLYNRCLIFSLLFTSIIRCSENFENNWNPFNELQLITRHIILKPNQFPVYRYFDQNQNWINPLWLQPKIYNQNRKRWIDNPKYIPHLFNDVILYADY